MFQKGFRQELCFLIVACIGILFLLIFPLYTRLNAQPAATATATVVSIADITGDGAAHAIQSSGSARWIQISCLTGNGAVIKLGDSNVSTARGIPCAAGGSFQFPPISGAPNMKAQDQYYALNTIYYVAQNNDKLSVIWGR